MIEAFFDSIPRFRSSKSGNIAITFALALIPLTLSVGAAVDYSQANRIKTKMQEFADAASISSVAQSSPGAVAAQAMNSNGSIPAGVTTALNTFNGNVSTINGYSNLTVTATVTKTGNILASNVTFSAKVPTSFMGMIGVQNVTINGSSSASATMPKYLDFYLMLDVSGSMGLPSTDSEQTRLAAINPDNYSAYPNGCTFACHWTAQNVCSDSGQKYPTNSYCMGYALSRTAGNSSNTPVSACSSPGTSACIQLRADAVGYAVQQLFVTANSQQAISGQFRIGLYPFIQHLYAYFPQTTNISGSATNSSTINYAAANLATLLDTGSNATLGSGGTHFENAFPTMNSTITSVGDGSTTSSRIPFVFLVTDGAQNYQTQWNGGWSGSNSATTIDPTLCTPLKTRGITIAILYIPYLPIQNPTTFANSEDFAVNAAIPSIPGALQSCASPNFFFTANTPTDITAALNAMFAQSLMTAHVTQ